MQLILTGVIILALVFVFAFDGDKDKVFKKNKTKEVKSDKTKEKASASRIKKRTQDNINFESIQRSGGEDSPALIIKDKDVYIGVAEIYGVNYNLLSTMEKLTLEEVFQKTLNGLEYPIQIYIQSKKINLDSYNMKYNKRIDELKEMLKLEKVKFLKEQENSAQIRQLEDINNNIIRLDTQIQYGLRVIDFINRVASSDDILDKKYFIITPYYYDKSKFNQEQTEEEKYQTAYNTLSNRLNSILTSLNGATMEGKILNEIELAELLYTSLNKEDADKYKLKNAVKSGFNNKIVRARPVEFKKIDEEIRLIEEEYKKNIENAENGVFFLDEENLDEKIS